MSLCNFLKTFLLSFFCILLFSLTYCKICVPTLVLDETQDLRFSILCMKDSMLDHSCLRKLLSPLNNRYTQSLRLLL